MCFIESSLSNLSIICLILLLFFYSIVKGIKIYYLCYIFLEFLLLIYWILVVVYLILLSVSVIFVSFYFKLGSWF